MADQRDAAAVIKKCQYYGEYYVHNDKTFMKV